LAHRGTQGEGWTCSPIANISLHWETACVRPLLRGRTPEYCDKPFELIPFYEFYDMMRL